MAICSGSEGERLSHLQSEMTDAFHDHILLVLLAVIISDGTPTSVYRHHERCHPDAFV